MPSTLVGLVVFAASVGPGWAFIRIAEKWTPRRERTPLQEAAELVVVGATATAISVLLVLVLAQSHGWLASSTLLKEQTGYIAKEPLHSLVALMTVLGISYGGATFVAFVLYTPHRVPKKERSRIHPNDTVWYGAFSRDLPKKRAVWLDVDTVDGWKFAGILRSFPSDETERREISLRRPTSGYIKMVDPEGKEAFLNSDSLILSDAQIRAIYVRYVPLKD